MALAEGTKAALLLLSARKGREKNIKGSWVKTRKVGDHSTINVMVKTVVTWGS